MTGVMVLFSRRLVEYQVEEEVARGSTALGIGEAGRTARRSYDIQRVCVLPTRLLRIPQHKQSMVLFMV